MSQLMLLGLALLCTYNGGQVTASPLIGPPDAPPSNDPTINVISSKEKRAEIFCYLMTMVMMMMRWLICLFLFLFQFLFSLLLFFTLFYIVILVYYCETFLLHNGSVMVWVMAIDI